MKTELTKEQVLEALQTHKTVQKAATALKIKYPVMQKYLRKYNITGETTNEVNNHDVPTKLTDDAGYHSFKHWLHTHVKIFK